MRKAKNTEAKYTPPVLSRLLARMAALFLLGGAYMLILTVNGEMDAEESIAGLIAMAALFAACYFGGASIRFSHLKKYYIEKKVDDLIRKDTGNMEFSIKVYNSLPSKKMLTWIRDLNPAAAEAVSHAIKANKRK